MKKMFVYGTLMDGQLAHNRLNGANRIGKAILRDYELLDLGDFPGIQPHVGGSVVGELYEVDDDMITSIDSYEGEGTLYDREIVRVFTYGDKLSDQFPVVYENSCRVYAYIYKDQSDHPKKLDFMWGTTEDDYVWYAAYGSNIDEDRFNCYIEGGRCSANGKYYDGCKDKSKWIEEDAALYSGSVYSSNNSSSWNGKGVAFYDENERSNFMKGNAFMRLYKIRRGQMEDIQIQEGKSPNWYGRVVAVGIHTDEIPVYTITAEHKGAYSEPDLSYINLIRDASRKVCEKYGITVDCGLETALILMARNPRYEEKPSDKKDGDHPYRLLCMNCLREEKNCTCKRDDPYRYRYYQEIDEEMFDAVRIFNQKGYFTHACCQGSVKYYENKVRYNSYVAFSEYIDEDLPVIGIDSEFVRIKRRRKNNSFNAIYIECEYKIGKTNAEAQEEKAHMVQEAAKKAWLMTAKAWPDRRNAV